MKKIFHMINNRSDVDPPKDADDLFDTYNKNAGGGKIKDFCCAFNEISITHGFTKSAVNDVLQLLRDNTTSLKIPLSGSSVTTHSGDVTVNKLSSYTDKDEKGMSHASHRRMNFVTSHASHCRHRY